MQESQEIEEFFESLPRKTQEMLDAATEKDSKVIATGVGVLVGYAELAGGLGVAAAVGATAAAPVIAIGIGLLAYKLAQKPSERFLRASIRKILAEKKDN
jgi:hypothetical protein